MRAISGGKQVTPQYSETLDTQRHGLFVTPLLCSENAPSRDHGRSNSGPCLPGKNGPFSLLDRVTPRQEPIHSHSKPGRAHSFRTRILFYCGKLDLLPPEFTHQVS